MHAQSSFLVMRYGQCSPIEKKSFYIYYIVKNGLPFLKLIVYSILNVDITEKTKL